jgi:hypothetical protein
MSTNIETTTEKNKLKYSSTVATPVEKEITLPYYYRESKFSGTLVKIESEDRVISVLFWDNGCYVSVRQMSDAYSEIDKGTPITEEEFNEVLTSALSKIQNL